MSGATRTPCVLAGRTWESKLTSSSSELFDIWNISFVFFDPGEDELYPESESAAYLLFCLLWAVLVHRLETACFGLAQDSV